MTLKDTLQLGMSNLISKAGKQISIKYYSQTYDDVYDDKVSLNQSGTTQWTSGIVLPIDTTQGSYDSILLEQGKLSNNSQRLYVSGGLGITGSELQVKIGLGSPSGEHYVLIPEGVINYEVENQSIYKKIYIKRLTGSLLGE